MKKSVIFLTMVIMILTMIMGALPTVALENNEHNSVEEQIPPEEANATPLKDANGEEIAFEVGEAENGNPTAGIIAMVAVFGVCLFFCGEAIYSYIKKSKKRRAEMFENIDRE